MKKRLERLLKPASVAVFGGEWAAAMIRQCRDGGYAGDIWPVHPDKPELSGIPCFRSLDDLPGVPDASFIGVNNETTIDLVKALCAKGAGGAICFASGFSETAGQDVDAESRQARLISAAGDMPVIGPNCYGLINYLDKVVLWPDVHGGKTVESGIAVIMQSSNMAINLTMQQRGLPLAYLLTAGNQAQTSLAELASTVLEDDRVTALGLHIEGFTDIRAYERLASRAWQLGKRIVVLKTGESSLARAALLSHTRSLSGNDAAATAFLDRLGMRRVRGLGEFIETLKVLNLPRKVGGYRLLSMSCSGGEAALIGDAGTAAGLQFPALNDLQINDLRVALGQDLTLANPLDYHTTIWNEDAAMQAMITGMLQSHEPTASDTVAANDQQPSLADIGLLVLDFPRKDRCESVAWHSVLQSYIHASRHWPAVTAVLATLPENMPESVSDELLANGIVALCGMGDGMKALYNAAWLENAGTRALSAPVWLADDAAQPFVASAFSVVQGSGLPLDGPSARRASQEAWGLVQSAQVDRDAPRQLDESTAKRWLSRFGVKVPVNVRLSFADVRSSLKLARALDKSSPAFTYPVVAKGLGVVHKSEANAIALDIHNRRDLERAIRQIDCAGGCLIEEQVQDVIAELLVSVIHDPVHGLMMTIAAGGVTTEILADSAQCLIPATRNELDRRVQSLRCAPLLKGFRNRPVVDNECLLDALEAVQRAALQLGERLVELEINPLMCAADCCIAVDAYVAVTDMNIAS